MVAFADNKLAPADLRVVRDRRCGNDALCGGDDVLTDPGPDNTWFTDDDTQSNYGANEIIYCGYRYDAEPENYYARNRYHAPHLGRWLTRDPIGYQGGINLYAYVASSPVGNVDAAGLGGGNPNLYPPPPPLAPGAQNLINQYSGRNARNYPANQPPPYSGAGGAVLGPLLAGGWYFTGQQGMTVVGYTHIQRVSVDGKCVTLGLPVYAPAAQVARGGGAPAWFSLGFGGLVGVVVGAGTTLVSSVATLDPFVGAIVGGSVGVAAGGAVDSAMAGEPYQTRWVRVYGPTWVGTTPVAVPSGWQR